MIHVTSFNERIKVRYGKFLNVKNNYNNNNNSGIFSLLSVLWLVFFDNDGRKLILICFEQDFFRKRRNLVPYMGK